MWGFVNENALTLLVSRIATCPFAAAALAAYNSVTYLAAAVGTAGAAALFASGSLVPVGVAAAALCALGLVFTVASQADRSSPTPAADSSGG